MTVTPTPPRMARTLLASLAGVVAAAALASVSSPVQAHGGYHRGHARPGVVVRVGPPVAPWRYHGGYRASWWGPGYVRPAYGYIVDSRPLAYTLVTIAGVGYLLSNGVYYREVPGGGYEVVPPPTEALAAAAASGPAPAGSRLYVYPARGQSAEQQATDEYECHAWAVGQSGFDPSSAAAGQPVTADASQREGYRRANMACLEGRGYSVR